MRTIEDRKYRRRSSAPKQVTKLKGIIKRCMYVHMRDHNVEAAL